MGDIESSSGESVASSFQPQHALARNSSVGSQTVAIEKCPFASANRRIHAEAGWTSGGYYLEPYRLSPRRLSSKDR